VNVHAGYRRAEEHSFDAEVFIHVGPVKTPPGPRICQFLRCSGVALASRGYQAIGTDSLRPSDKVTTSSVSVTISPTASGSFALSKVLMPFLQISGGVVTHDPEELVQLVSRESI